MSDKPSCQPDLHRLLPQSSEAEQGLLASILLDPRRVLALCEERGTDAGWFHIPAHAAIFTALDEMHRAKKGIDFITLATAMKEAGTLDSAGGAPFITHLFTFLPTAANAAHYLATVEEKFTLRRIIGLATGYAARAYDPQQSAAELLDTFQAEVCAINRPGAELTGTATPLGEGLVEAVNALEHAYKNRGKLIGIPTGLVKLDDMVMGFKGPQSVVIAGRPGMGKSAMLLNIAEASARAGFGTLFYTLEMSVQELCQRFLGSVAEVNLQRFKDGFLSEGDFTRISSAIQPSLTLPLWLHAAPGLSIQDLRAHARAFFRAKKIGAIFVDYLQLMRSATRRAEQNRAQELAEITGGLKRLAMELQIPIFAGAQLNRDAEEGRAPKLSQLRESGAIEQDADVVILLHRPGYHQEDGDPTEAVGIIAKHRNGPIGDVPLRFIGEHTRFTDADPGQTGDQRRTNASRQKQQTQREWTDHTKRDL